MEGNCESFSQEMLPCTISGSLSCVCQGLQHMDEHCSLPNPTPLYLRCSLPWSHLGFCGHFEWLHLCNRNDLYSDDLSSTPMSLMNFFDISHSLNILFHQISSIILALLYFLANQSCMFEHFNFSPSSNNFNFCVLAYTNILISVDIFGKKTLKKRPQELLD